MEQHKLVRRQLVGRHLDLTCLPPSPPTRSRATEGPAAATTPTAVARSATHRSPLPARSRQPKARSRGRPPPRSRGWPAAISRQRHFNPSPTGAQHSKRSEEPGPSHGCRTWTSPACLHNGGGAAKPLGNAPSRCRQARALGPIHLPRGIRPWRRQCAITSAHISGQEFGLAHADRHLGVNDAEPSACIAADLFASVAHDRLRHRSAHSALAPPSLP
jgi:hypothetical protein